MIVAGRNDVRRALMRIASADRKPWQRGAGSVRMVRPSEIQGKEADVLLILPSEFIAAHNSVAAAVRGFLTLVGRARQSFWLLFTSRPNLAPLPQRVFATLLRSFLETRVAAPLPPLTEIDERLARPLAHLGVCFHELDNMALLSHRGRAFAVYDWSRVSRASLDQIDQRELVKQKGWTLIYYDTLDKKLQLTDHSLRGEERYFWDSDAEDEIRRRMAKIDREIDG